MVSESMQQLIAGYKRFQKHHFEDDQDLYHDFVVHGQSPETMVIACSDSRVDPAIVMDAQAGELFVVRNVANLVPPYDKQNHACGVATALLYAVDVLKIEQIIVFGHSHCGGIQALMKAEEDIDPEHQSIRDWAEFASEAKAEVMAELGDATFEAQCHACELASVRLSLDHLRSYPWLNKQVEAGKLDLHGWLFDLDSGDIKVYDQSSGVFGSLP
jgi:carbonic anhydrase